MVSLFGHSVYHFDVLTVWFCLLAVSQAAYGCPGGFYGPNCSNTCPDTNCYCHLETGTCQGCKPGYQGYLCKSDKRTPPLL
uniref:Uncharacterized protein n=1 Tax=Magallana gigas TaxID=29159 RepID=A0A8W8ML37_MAGGI